MSSRDSGILSPNPLRRNVITKLGGASSWGVTITDVAVDEKQTTIFCTPVARDPRCPTAAATASIATP